eukprot:1120976-Pelagomonas_calceolata.AAC.4
MENTASQPASVCTCALDQAVHSPDTTFACSRKCTDHGMQSAVQARPSAENTRCRLCLSLYVCIMYQITLRGLCVHARPSDLKPRGDLKNFSRATPSQPQGWVSQVSAAVNTRDSSAAVTKRAPCVFQVGTDVPGMLLLGAPPSLGIGASQ